MKPEFIDSEQIILIGMSFFGDPFQNSVGWTEKSEVHRVWKRFITFYKKNKEKIINIKNEEVTYELWIEHEETKTKGFYEIFTGIEIESIANPPVEALIKVLPKTKYAVFTLKGTEIKTDWSNEIFKKWFPQSGYKSAFNYLIELYDERFLGLDKIEKSELSIYVPVTKLS